MEISATHKLVLLYQNKCATLHGHNRIVTIYYRSEWLSSGGTVADFTQIKRAVKERLDHQNLNEVLPLNPAAEDIACWVCKRIPRCYKVRVQKSEANTVIYKKD